jgi:hypothetical protein
MTTVGKGTRVHHTTPNDETKRIAWRVFPVKPERFRRL